MLIVENIKLRFKSSDGERKEQCRLVKAYVASGTSQPHSNGALAKSRYVSKAPYLNFPSEVHMACSVFLLHRIEGGP